MDVQRFLDQSAQLFDGDPYSSGSSAPRYEDLVATVDGMTTWRELALLNLAATILPPDECYVEVGSFKGRSICGATHEVSGKTYYILENFVEFGMLGVQARNELGANLATYCGGKDVRLLEGDAFATLRTPGAVQKPVGVYFYDGEHTRLAHFVALGVIEPLLADEALILVDDATWPLVQAAHERYISIHPGWEVVARWDARGNDDPEWANGLHALRFQRPVGTTPAQLTREVKLALTMQRRMVGPARRAAWKTLYRLPWLVPLAKRLEPKNGHHIGVGSSVTDSADR